MQVIGKMTESEKDDFVETIKVLIKRRPIAKDENEKWIIDVLELLLINKYSELC